MTMMTDALSNDRKSRDTAGQSSNETGQAVTARPVGPVMQFALLLTPIVMSCFYLVYALVGWFLEGQNKLNWALEALDVGLWVTLGISVFGLLVIAYTLWRGGNRRHPLVISSVAHMTLAILLTLSIFVNIRL